MNLPVVARVPCGGGQHRVALSPRGRLVLLDHHLRRERAFVRLGGAKAPCLQFLDSTATKSSLPPAGVHILTDHFTRTAVLTSKRLRGRAEHERRRVWDFLPIRERMTAWINREVRRQFFTCNYVMPGPPGTFDFALAEIYRVGKARHHGPRLVWHERTNIGDRWDSGGLYLCVPWRWWRAVHLAGLAVVRHYGRRCFVLDNFTPGAATPWVRFVWQTSPPQGGPFWGTMCGPVQGGVVTADAREEPATFTTPAERDGLIPFGPWR